MMRESVAVVLDLIDPFGRSGDNRCECRCVDESWPSTRCERVERFPPFYGHPFDRRKGLEARGLLGHANISQTSTYLESTANKLGLATQSNLRHDRARSPSRRREGWPPSLS